jgi:hypothetical protein
VPEALAVVTAAEAVGSQGQVAPIRQEGSDRVGVELQVVGGGNDPTWCAWTLGSTSDAMDRTNAVLCDDGECAIEPL